MSTKRKNYKVKEAEKSLHKSISKKVLICAGCIVLLLFLLAIRIFWIQFIDGDSYKMMAYNQQTINQVISPNRGTIYDSTGKPLAVSAGVDTVSINPTYIKAKNKEKVAKALSDILSLDYNTVLDKVNSTSAFQTIARKVEHDQIESLKTWMNDNKITKGINIDEDSKRYYPYNNLASNLIGFCSNDNRGLSGIEYKWNSVLTGTPGRIVSLKGSKSQEIPNDNEQYIPAENGSDIVLTIDYNLQSIAEKYLKQAVEENQCSRGGNVIIMEPSTGDIKAMATYPDYNLNTPSEPYTTSQRTAYNALTSQEDRNHFLEEMRKNVAVSNGYEPGSTFKIITAAIGLEEGKVSTDTKNDFYCSGTEQIYDTAIKCWRYYNPHGYQTLREALEHSCNPAFMQLGARIGTRTLYQYYKAFGLFNKTGIDTAGETNSIFYNEDDVGPVDLATMSFGQRFTITPLQLITAVSAIANDGVLMKPRVVKQVVNSDTGVITNIEPQKVREVVSKTTSDKIKDLMYSVVQDGTGRYAKLDGYSVGGKSGTSEPTYSKKDDGYTSSFIAISPVENPQLVVLVTLYKPQGKKYQGGETAGPVVRQILSEALPYLGIPSSNTATTSNSNDSDYATTILPDVKGKTMEEAEKILKNAGFYVSSHTSKQASEAIVQDQVPKSGVSLISGSQIYLYDEEQTEHSSTTVPDLKGLTSSQAINALKSKNLNISIEGSGKVISQTPTSGTSTEVGSMIHVTLMDEIKDAY